MIRSAVVTVTSTPTPLTTPEQDQVQGKSVMFIVPEGGQPVRVGGPLMTWADGFPWPAGQPYAADMDSAEVTYLMVQSGSQPINVLWRGV